MVLCGNNGGALLPLGKCRMKPTPEQVKALWTHMTETYGSEVQNKASAEEMQLIGRVLDVMGILDKDAFLTQFTTTIGRTIYTPFTVGVAAPGHDLWAQMVICAHEHEHVVQARDALFPVRYLLDQTWRATYEGEAYRTSMNLEHWHRGKVPPVEGYVNAAKSYGLDEKHLTFFRKYLKLSVPTLEQGGIPGPAALVAIAWLEKHAPELKG